MISSHQKLWVASALAAAVVLKLAWTGVMRIRHNKEGRVAVVTGAAGGVGKETVQLLVQQGWRVYACDVNAAGLEAAGFPNAQVTTVAFDVRNQEQCQKLVDRVQTETGGKLDALLNVAGIVQPGPVLGFSIDKVKFLYDINTFGPIALTQLFMPMLLKGRFGGSVINLASISATVSWPWSGSYSASKAALLSFSDALRREALANSLPLRVSVVIPGPIKTAMISQVPESLLQWANANAESPFRAGCAREANLMLGMKDWGFSQDSVSVSAGQVASVCVSLLDDKYPVAWSFVMSYSFQILYTLCARLPVWLGDRLLVAM